jgi:subtilisin-like proprotein convertase family protein
LDLLCLTSRLQTRMRRRRVAAGLGGLALASVAVPGAIASAAAEQRHHKQRQRFKTVTKSFANLAVISIPDEGKANPYPSFVVVKGLKQGVIKDVDLHLEGFTHTYPNDLNIMLVAPDGVTSVVVMAGVGGDINADGYTVIFDDEAPGGLTDQTPLQSGSYKPSIVGTPTFDAPAPLTGYGTTLSRFDGMDPNGTWTLYVFDGSSPDHGSLAGWSITIRARVLQ